MDECYTYYGVWHDSFGEFYSSMLTGINFSPPLYFLFNFFIQLVYPTSIEFLRVQSLIWALIGIIICFIFSRKSFGLFPSIVGTLLVSCHSNLLLTQSQEARQYTMFFACGAWVLLMQSIEDKQSKKRFTLTLLAHLSLCQVHYLGIIFSALVGVAYLCAQNQKFILSRIPLSIYLSWLLSVPLYLYFLSNQQSLLNTWPKPNRFSDLLTVYQSGTLALFSIIPILVIACITQNSVPNDSVKKKCNNGVLLTSIFWYGVPFLIWGISHLFPINLFNDRYFIPKDAALIFMVCFACNKIVPINKGNGLKSKVVARAPALAVLTLCLALLFVHHRRSSFSYDESRNYHYWLLSHNELINFGIPVVLCGDPAFFPNSYTKPDSSYFWVNDDILYRLYSQYSSKLKLVNASKLNDFESFILVGGKENFAHFQSAFFQSKDLGKFNENLTFHCTLFEKRTALKLPLPG